MVRACAPLFQQRRQEAEPDARAPLSGEATSAPTTRLHVGRYLEPLFWAMVPAFPNLQITPERGAAVLLHMAGHPGNSLDARAKYVMTGIDGTMLGTATAGASHVTSADASRITMEVDKLLDRYRMVT